MGVKTIPEDSSRLELHSPGGEEQHKVKTQVPQWRTVFTAIVVLVAIIMISSLENDQKKERAGVVIATTALLWCTEAMPLMITALMPAILFPFAGVLDTKEISAVYWNYISMLMLGTFLMAESVEACGLHRRIALAILSLLGRSEALLMMGSILVAWKLSMFMSNTATTAMMLPIIGAIIDSLRTIQRDIDRKNGGIKMGDVKTNGSIADTLPEGEEGTVEEADPPQFVWFCKGLILSIPYGASMGGIATLTGTPPNLVFKSNYEKFYSNGPTVDFGKWMAFCYPISFLLVVVGWHVLVLMYARSSYLDMIVTIFRKIGNLVVPGTFHIEESDDQKKWRQVNNEIKKKYRALGPLRFPEICLFCLVIILVILWLLRDPAGMEGWAIKHGKSMVDGFTHHLPYHPYLKDAWVAIVVGVLLFNIPTENPLEGTLLWRAPPGKKFKRSKKLLTMDVVLEKTPWEVLVLLGGGYAIAEGCEKSGLSQWLGDSFGFLEGQNNVLVALVICLMVACLTEVASNTASTTLLMPVLAPMAKTLNVNPLFLMISGTVAASLAFCLPSATGPNAMVFTFKEIRVVDMLRTGVIMNVLSVLVVVFGVSTWTLPILGISDNIFVPSWVTPEE